ncbi:hypothetical protein WK75_02295 [Burkholderia ubonensis]|nr:hypothetical protein WK75_02295 [Burkholderia ubonensis]
MDVDRVSKRAIELGIGTSGDLVNRMIRASIEKVIPDARLHKSESAFDDYIRSKLDDIALNDPDTSSQMAMTNGDGVDEVYLPFELSDSEPPSPGESFEIEVDGHISMSQDIDRPYSGHKIEIEATVIVERTGRQSYAEPDITIDQARLDYDW